MTKEWQARQKRVWVSCLALSAWVARATIGVQAIRSHIDEDGQTDDDAYTNGLRWSDLQERPGASEEVAAQVAGEIDQQYLSIDWRATAATLKR